MLKLVSAVCAAVNDETPCAGAQFATCEWLRDSPSRCQRRPFHHTAPERRTPPPTHRRDQPPGVRTGGAHANIVRAGADAPTVPVAAAGRNERVRREQIRKQRGFDTPRTYYRNRRENKFFESNREDLKTSNSGENRTAIKLFAGPTPCNGARSPSDYIKGVCAVGGGMVFAFRKLLCIVKY